jgi:uncharacterized integral membrane protein
VPPPEGSGVAAPWPPEQGEGFPPQAPVPPANPEPPPYPSPTEATAEPAPTEHATAEHATAEQATKAHPTIEAAARVDAVVPTTRASRAWMRIVPSLILLAIMLVFVFQNLRSTKVTFMTASGRFPLAVALLAAAALGALSVLAIGSVRIVQLRKVIRRHRQADVSQTAGDT